MGSAMARNLLDRGYRISVWNVDSGMTAPLVAAGAMAFESLESLVEVVDAAIAMLWDDEVAREISLGRIIPGRAERSARYRVFHAFTADV